MEVISNKIVKARKTHHCDFCGCEIECGSLYNQQFNKDCGDVWSVKMHIECLNLLPVLGLNKHHDGISEECFCDAVRDYIDKQLHNDNSKGCKCDNIYNLVKRISQKS